MWLGYMEISQFVSVRNLSHIALVCFVLPKKDERFGPEPRISMR